MNNRSKYSTKINIGVSNNNLNHISISGMEMSIRNFDKKWKWEGWSSPEGQAILLGIVFYFIFMAFYTIQGFSAKLYGTKLGSNVEFTIYLVFAIFCNISPAIVNKIGCRLSMFIGSLGYAILVVASLFYFIMEEKSKYEYIVIIGACFLGFGASLLWTGQGKMILQYSSGDNTGLLFSIFWSIFSLSAVSGGFLTYFYFAKSNFIGNISLYIIFLILIIMGSLSVFLLKPLDEMIKNSNNSMYINKGSFITDDPLEFLIDNNNCNSDQNEIDQVLSWKEEFKASITVFITSTDIQMFTIIMFYTGFNQPYQLITFGNNYCDKESLGLILSVFYFMEIIGCIFAGKLFDNSTSVKYVSKKCLIIFIIISMIGNIIAAYFELYYFGNNYGLKNIKAILFIMIQFSCWGISDSMIQAYIYWLIQKQNPNGKQQARVIGYYKMVQSLGWCIGFALVPTNRCPRILQLMLTVVFCIFGSFLTIYQLSKNKDVSKYIN